MYLWQNVRVVLLGHLDIPMAGSRCYPRDVSSILEQCRQVCVPGVIKANRRKLSSLERSFPLAAHYVVIHWEAD
jgi:hypothetical protein